MIEIEDWEAKANEHLMGYITRRLREQPHVYSAPNSRQQREAVEILVRYKHAWATDMHEGRGVDPDSGEYIGYTFNEQRKAWGDCMRMAESEINALGARKAA